MTVGSGGDWNSTLSETHRDEVCKFSRVPTWNLDALSHHTTNLDLPRSKQYTLSIQYRNLFRLCKRAIRCPLSFEDLRSISL